MLEQPFSHVSRDDIAHVAQDVAIRRARGDLAGGEEAEKLLIDRDHAFSSPHVRVIMEKSVGSGAGQHD